MIEVLVTTTTVSLAGTWMPVSVLGVFILAMFG